MRNPKNLHRFLLTLILGTLMIPVIQLKFNFVYLEPLDGAITKTEPVKLSAETWFSGNFQQNKDSIYTQQFGLRSFFIRLNNQIDYSVFSKIHAKNVVEGKEMYFYEENYIDAYYGRDFVGIDSIKERLVKLKFVQEELRKRNKTLLVVLAPGKASYYPEYIPTNKRSKKKITNYEVYARLTQEMNINVIDFHAYFEENKNSSKYPVYSQFGVHWSRYAAGLAADSVICYLEKERKINMSNVVWKDLKMAYPYGDDMDILAGMNLLKKYKTFDMAYPYTYLTNGETKPSIVIITDSYYWGMNDVQFPYAFHKQDVWYYNEEVYTRKNMVATQKNTLRLHDEIESHDVFMILSTDANLPRFGFGVVDELYNYFKKEN